MHKLLIVVAVGLIASTGFETRTTAKPCPPTFRDCRRPHPPPPPPPPPPPQVTTIYQRAIPSAPPVNLDRGSLGRLLAGSMWVRLGSRDQIRFVEPPGHFARPPSPDRSIRAVTIDLIRSGRTLAVNVDGSLYTVTACPMRYDGPRPAVLMTTCLEHREAIGTFGGQGYGGVTYGGR